MCCDPDIGENAPPSLRLSMRAGLLCCPNTDIGEVSSSRLSGGSGGDCPCSRAEGPTLPTVLSWNILALSSHLVNTPNVPCFYQERGGKSLKP